MKQVKPVLADFFDKWPNPDSFLNADVKEVKSFIKSLGFQMSGKRPHEQKIKGVGLYALQSYDIFVGGYLIEEPHDKELKSYVKWALEERRGDGSEVHHAGR